MSKTITAIAVGVLQTLGRLPDGQVAPPSQIKIVKEAYEGLYDDLLNNSLVNWAATDSIPSFAVYPIEQLTCARCAGKFGVDAGQYLILADAMEAKLAENISLPSEEETTPGVFF